jgi:hypothetical protein
MKCVQTRTGGIQSWWDVWSGHKKSKNQNIKIGACGGWNTKITYIEDYVQNFKVLQQELSEQRRFEDGPRNKL